MKLIGVMLKGSKEIEYFEVDSWAADKGVVFLRRNNEAFPIAVFPFENLVGVVDFSAKAHLDETQAKAKLQEIYGKES